MASDLDDIKIETVKSFDVLPEDMYPVVISAIKKEEAKKYDFQAKKSLDEMETVLNFEFTVLDGDYQGRKLFQKIRPKLGGGQKPTNLWKVWKAVDGIDHPKEDFDKFHLSSLLNRNLKVVTENKKKNDKEFTNIASYLQLKTKATDTGVEYDTMTELVDEASRAVDEEIPADISA